MICSRLEVMGLEVVRDLRLFLLGFYDVGWYKRRVGFISFLFLGIRIGIDIWRVGYN